MTLYRMVQTTKNFLLVPIGISVLAISYLYTAQVSWLCLAGLFVLFLLLKQRGSLVILSVLFSLVLGLRTLVYLEQVKLKQTQFDNESCQIIRDTVKINGANLSFTGKIQHQKFKVYYRLKSEGEKNWWQHNRVQQLKLSGKAKAGDEQRNLKGFDQKDYYLGLGITGQITATKLTEPKNDQRDLSYLRESWLLHIDRNFSKRVASYIKALVLGYQDLVFEENRELYQNTGLLHLFALSGQHIQFYLGFIHLLFKRFGWIRETRLVGLSLAGGVIYFLTGGAISVLRAILSFLIVFFLKTVGLKLSKLDQWSLMIASLLLLQPTVFLSVSGRLSVFLALLLVYLPEKFPQPLKFNLVFSFLMIPLLLFEFGEWSLLGGVFTLLTFAVFQWFFLPVCLVLLVLSFIGTLPNVLIHSFDGSFLVLEKILAFFSLRPLVLGKPGSGLFCLLFLGLFLWLAWYPKEKQRIRLVSVLLILLIFSVSFSPQGMVAFLDVGQGDSILIKLPFKQEVFLIDTGGKLQFKQADWQRSATRSPSEYNLVPALKAQGISKIDHLILTHNDADHMGELENVLKHFTVKKLYVAKGAQSGIAQRLKQINQAKTKIKLVKTGDQIGRKLKLHVLAPEHSQGENNDSIVTYFTINQTRFLLTGDLEKTGEQKVIRQFPQLRADVLKVGHHGSNTSTSKELLAQLRPKAAIISAGVNNRYGHPTVDTLKILQTQHIQTYRTDQQGMIYYEWSALTKTASLKTTIDFNS